ncbi:MAG TPA: T9SS type A sorting domain-containing protein [Ignavibacteriaceae bacterium]|nr:T9SS type A sorting domain-containing protein [Ignavibacteriaceae bacterium]
MKFLQFSLLLLLLISVFSINSYSQTFNGTWQCDYATTDDDLNGTGYNTIDNAVIKNNVFVALVTRITDATSYLVGYSNADSIHGRMGNYAYNGGYYMNWVSGFDQVGMSKALCVDATPDSFIYVANNDPERNILVFKMTADSIESTEFRMPTNSDSIFAVVVDDNGRVYATVRAAGVDKLIVYPPISDQMWGSHTGNPMFEMPFTDAGDYRGITVSGNGNLLYVSNYQTKKIYCYYGNANNGYTLIPGFNFTLADDFTSTVGPWGLTLMKNKNILFVSCATNYISGGYTYGRIYALNPNTGAVLDTIDLAEWNFLMTGGYSTRSGGTTPGNASGYVSSYYVDYDDSYNLYNHSYFGWTVDKWSFSGELPTIQLTVDVKETGEIINDYNLYQNYPNPFNPATTISFNLKEQSNVTLTIYNIMGEVVSKLINNQTMAEGNHSLRFDASNLTSGLYLYELKVGSVTLNKKMMLLK